MFGSLGLIEQQIGLLGWQMDVSLIRDAMTAVQLGFNFVFFLVLSRDFRRAFAGLVVRSYQY